MNLDIFKERLIKQESIKLSLRIRPGAKVNQIKEILEDGSIKIDIKAPSEDGKANEAVISFLSKEFDVPKAAVSIVSGHTSRQKIIRVSL